MRIVFLCTRLAGYFHNCVYQMVEANESVEATIIAYPKSKNAPFEFKEHSRIEIKAKSNIEGYTQLRKIVEHNSKPDVIYLSGWSDRQYLRIAAIYRKLSSTQVILGMDNQWKNTIRQKILTKLSIFTIKRLADFVMVPDIRQYEYARRLGFSKDKILMGLYSANTSYFNSIANRRFRKEKDQWNIVFIGNMWEDKGVVELVAAFSSLSNKYNWNLHLIGGGPLVEEYKGFSERIFVHGFVQPDELEKCLINADAFCLPSYHDAWAVVLHEAAATGLPIIATDVCGAVDSFVFEGFNGYRCKPKSVKSLTEKLEALFNLSQTDLELFGNRSLDLSKRFSSDFWASNFINFLD